jgi:hypothetical protein
MSPLPRVMAAVTPPGLKILRPMIAGRCQVIPAYTMPVAMELVRDRIQLVVCSLHFDESRMFDLLSYMRIAMPRLPVVCCAMMQTQLSEAAMHDLTVAARELGAVDFIDMRQLASADYRTRNEFAERIISRLAAPPASRRSA